MTIHPYLQFNGQCKQAFEFYAQALGGQIEAMVPHAGTPAEGQVPPEWLDKIMHARLVSESAILMGSDAPPNHFQPAAGFSVAVMVKDPAEAERIFHALEEGASVRMPIQQTFWSPRFGMLVDRFGVPWMINCEPA